MGSGKSSILNILKLNTEIHTIDLDDIVLKESKDDLESIEQLFEKHGEEYFRDCEVKAFQKIYQNPNTVIQNHLVLPLIHLFVLMYPFL